MIVIIGVRCGLSNRTLNLACQVPRSLAAGVARPAASRRFYPDHEHLQNTHMAKGLRLFMRKKTLGTQSHGFRILIPIALNLL